MTPELKIAHANAQKIVNAGGTENADYAVAVGFLSLIAQVEALTVPQAKKDFDIASYGEFHDLLAEYKTLSEPESNVAWFKLVSLINTLAAPTIPAIPGTKDGA